MLIKIKDTAFHAIKSNMFGKFASTVVYAWADISVELASYLMMMYNDGDSLSADDQSYIVDHVFNYHPDKVVKMGTRIDYVMMTLEEAIGYVASDELIESLGELFLSINLQAFIFLRTLNWQGSFFSDP